MRKCEYFSLTQAFPEPSGGVLPLLRDFGAVPAHEDVREAQMKRLFTATVLTVVCAAGLAAQSPARQDQSQEAKEKEKIVTVTGCLRNGEEPSTFVLSNVKWLDKPQPDSTAATGTSGTDQGASGATLRLVGKPTGTTMSEHVGRMVEITGTIVDEAKPRPSDPRPDPIATGTGGDQTSRAQAVSAPKSEHTLNVRTVKTIGETCSAR